MRAIVCEQVGDPTLPLGSGVLRLKQDQPAPQIQPGCIRVRVTAASLNFPDALQVKGQYQVKPKLPFIPGSEVSGIVCQLGAGVKGFKPGDLVCAVTQGGAFAEEVVVPAAAAWHIPAGVDAAEAAGVPIVYGTADLALRHRARLQAGQTVLVLGASGGVGTAAVQISKLLGARVVAVTSGADKAAYLAQLGADAVVDTAAPAAAGQRLHKLVAAAAPKGVHVVFDPVGGQALFESLKCVAWGAQYLVIGFAAGDIPKVPANLLLVKNTTMHGIFWGSYMMKDYKVLADGLRQVLQWAGGGRLTLQVSHRFRLDQLPEAMAALLGRQVRGKVILTMDSSSSSSSSSRQGPGQLSKL
ncbi:hypothetical protein OEZ86_013145 [Tetradesmus obliquus]|nr:hypothetical protein OEZ86_013145 [Tetradesmus obliquus]